VEALPGPGRTSSPVLRTGLLADHSPIRDFGDRTCTHGFAEWLSGEFYGFLAILHAITVIAALLYLPFGKFFHIFQRPAQLGVKFYQAAGEAGESAVCKRCGGPFASRMHIDDLNRVLPQVGFDYRIEGSQFTWQEICPACKRKSLSLAQLRLREEAHG